MDPLITVDELAVSSGAVICDLRWDLTDPGKGRATYEEGHLPGAVFVDLDTDLAADPGLGGRHPLPTTAGFASTLGRLGVTPDSHVVVYDDAGGRIAARLWWMLHSIGHQQAQVLDGGYQAWVAADHPVERGWNQPSSSHYPEPDDWRGVVSHEDLDDVTVIDARAPARYRGEFEPVDPKAGHIPGAVNIPSDDNLDENGHFRPADALADLYADLPAEVAVSCGSGVTACHDALAMVVAGLPMPLVYVGSFSEWSRRDLPVVQGSTP